MNIPSFVLTILEQELYEIQAKLIHKIAKDHDLDAEALISQHLKKPLCVVPNTEKKVEIIRRNVERPSTPPDVRCIARVWNRGRGGQCTRKCHEEHGFYCMQHGKELQDKKSLRHGTIQDPPPREIFASRFSKQGFLK